MNVEVILIALLVFDLIKSVVQGRSTSRLSSSLKDLTELVHRIDSDGKSLRSLADRLNKRDDIDLSYYHDHPIRVDDFLVWFFESILQKGLIIHPDDVRLVDNLVDFFMVINPDYRLVKMGELIDSKMLLYAVPSSPGYDSISRLIATNKNVKPEPVGMPRSFSRTPTPSATPSAKESNWRDRVNHKEPDWQKKFSGNRTRFIKD